MALPCGAVQALRRFAALVEELDTGSGELRDLAATIRRIAEDAPKEIGDVCGGVPTRGKWDCGPITIATPSWHQDRAANDAASQEGYYDMSGFDEV